MRVLQPVLRLSPNNARLLLPDDDRDLFAPSHRCRRGSAAAADEPSVIIGNGSPRPSGGFENSGHAAKSLVMLLVGPDLTARFVTMTGDPPMGVVPVGELEQRQAQVLDGLKAAHPQQV